MTARIVRPEVARFVAEVRAQLGDLTADEVDELTGGLEADLSDAADTASLDDPAGYAAELRAAAGLPAPAPAPDRGRRGLATGLADLAARLEAQPWWPPVRDFAVAVRPAWWVLRGWVAYTVVVAAPLGLHDGVVPGNPLAFLLLAGCVVASVQIGRVTGDGAGRMRGALLVANVLAVLCLPVAAAVAQVTVVYDAGTAASAPPEQGIWRDGEPVRNIFAYDEQGRLLPAVQLYDQDGRPIDLAQDARGGQVDGSGTERAPVPARNVDGRELWNAFPLREQVTVTRDDGSPGPATLAPPAAPPFRSVAPLAVPSPSPTLTPSPSPSPTPSPTPSPSPSPSSSPSPTR